LKKKQKKFLKKSKDKTKSSKFEGPKNKEFDKGLESRKPNVMSCDSSLWWSHNR
jgi:hypothetical protein